MPTAHKSQLAYADRQEICVKLIANDGMSFHPKGDFRGHLGLRSIRTGLEVERDTRAFVQSSPRSLAGLTCRWQVPQTCSPPTATAATAREMRLKEALRHLGRQVLDCIFQSFSGE